MKKTNDEIPALNNKIIKLSKGLHDRYENNKINQLTKEIDQYYERLISISGDTTVKNELKLPDMGKIQLLDLTSDVYKIIQRDVIEGYDIGEAFNELVQDLINIGKQSEYTTVSPEKTSGKYHRNGKHKRAYEIGMLLNLLGGKKIMPAAALRVRRANADGRDADRCWDGIGEWRH